MVLNLYRSEFAALFKLSLPLVVAQLAQNTTSFVDALMVGRLGNESLAAIALGSTIFHFVNIVLCGVVLGVNPVVSQATGANDDEKANRAVCQGLWIGLFLFLPAFVFYWNAEPILILLGQSTETASASCAYLRAISWGLLPSLWTMALRGYLEGKSNTQPIMLISFLGVILNVVCNYVFMFGKLGFPAMGLVGTGYASSLVYTAVFAASFFYIGIKYNRLGVFRKIFEFNARMIWELVRVGAPIGMTLGFEVSMFSAAAIAMGTLGSDELAAHQIALQSASISFMIPLGMAIATSVRVGQAIGRKSAEQAAIAGHVGMASCISVMCISGLVFWLLPDLVISMYIDSSDPVNNNVIALASGFLGIAAVFQVVDGLQVAASASLRGLKDTTVAMVLSFFSYWGIGMIAGYFMCFYFGLNGNGLWWGMTLGLAAAAIMLPIRFQIQILKLKRNQLEQS